MDDIRAAERFSKAFDLMGIPVHDVSLESLHEFMEKVIRDNRKALVLNVNIHCVNLALHHDWLAQFLREAQLVFCDGDGVRWGLRVLGYSPPPKITYDRWIWQLAEWAARKGFRLFFLGAKPGVAARAAQNLKARYPQLQFAGVHDGYFNKEGLETDKVIDQINHSNADILICGFGMPLQEKWLQANWKRIRAHIFLTGGAVFDYASGQAKRAPDWMIRVNCEWVFRLWKEPGRLFNRYILGNPYFMIRVFGEKLRRIFK